MKHESVSPAEFARAASMNPMVRDVVLDWDNDGAYIEVTIIDTGQRYKIRHKGMVGRVA